MGEERLEKADALSLAAQHHRQQPPEVKVPIVCNKIYTLEEWTSKKARIWLARGGEGGQRRPTKAGRTSMRGNCVERQTDELLPKGRSSTLAMARTTASSSKANATPNDLILVPKPSFQA